MASPNKKTTKIGHQRGVKSTKATKPQILVDAEAKTDVVEFLNMFHIIGVESDRSWHTKTPFQYTIEGKKSVNSYGAAAYPLVCRNFTGTPALLMNEKLYRRIPLLSRFNKGRSGADLIRYTIPIAFVDDNMSVWHSTLKLETCHSVIGSWESKQQRYVPDRNLTLSERCCCDPFKKAEKFVLDAVPLQSNSEIMAIIKNVNQYAAKFVEDNSVNPLNFAMIPYMETLAKAGYVFIDRFYTNGTRLSQIALIGSASTERILHPFSKHPKQSIKFSDRMKMTCSFGTPTESSINSAASVRTPFSSHMSMLCP